MSHCRLWILAAGLSLAWLHPGAATAEETGPGYFATLAQEVRRTPTDSHNLAFRLHCLQSTARLVLAQVGPEALDKVLPPQRVEGVVRGIESGQDSLQAVNECLLQLCRLASQRKVLPNLRRVRFVTHRGTAVVACLFVPERPSDRALVFGHGGFAGKEHWLDVMAEVTRRTGCYTLSMDFEGCGESSGISSWSGRIDDFSAALDYLQKHYHIRNFAVGGHSGGGAYPAACAALKDRRVSVVILWDCIFDFYDTHLSDSAPDPGGNPATLLEQTLNANRGKRLVPAEIAPARKIAEHLDAIYQEIDTTLSHFRHPSAMLGKAQKTRRLAVLHIAAEDMLRQLGPRTLGQTFALPQAKAGPVRARFLGRPLAFRLSGLFNRPQGMWERWRQELGEATRFVVIPRTTHSFEAPGRQQAVAETVSWMQKHLGGR